LLRQGNFDTVPPTRGASFRSGKGRLGTGGNPGWVGIRSRRDFRLTLYRKPFGRPLAGGSGGVSRYWRKTFANLCGCQIAQHVAQRIWGSEEGLTEEHWFDVRADNSGRYGCAAKPDLHLDRSASF